MTAKSEKTILVKVRNCAFPLLQYKPKLVLIERDKLQNKMDELSKSKWRQSLSLYAFLESEAWRSPKLVRVPVPPPKIKKPRPRVSIVTCPPPTAK